MASRILRLSSSLRAPAQRFASSAASSSGKLPEVEVTALDNLVKVASVNSGRNDLVAVGLFFDAGSRYENAKNSGAGNLIDHLLLKGTVKRSEQALEEELGNLGARINTHFSREQSAVVARCPSKSVPKVVEILADIVQNPKLDDAAIDQTRAAVTAEIDEIINIDHKQTVFDNLHAGAYQGTPLGQSLWGNLNNIQRLTRADLEYYVASHFKAHRTVLAASGAVDHNELLSLANKHLSSLDNNFDGEVPTFTPCRYTGFDTRVRDDDIPHAYAAIAVEGVGPTHEDFLPLELIKTHVGSFHRTQLGGSVHPTNLAATCAKEGLCHSYESFNLAYNGTALFGIYFVSDPPQCYGFAGNLIAEWRRTRHRFTESDCQRAKKTLKANILRQIDGDLANCHNIGKQVLIHERYPSYDELARNIDGVALDKIIDVANKYINDRPLVVSAVGQHEGLQDYTNLNIYL